MSDLFVLFLVRFHFLFHVRFYDLFLVLFDVRFFVRLFARFLARFLFRFCLRFHVQTSCPIWCLIFFFDFLSDFFTGGSNSVGVRSLDFKFIRECMKINKIRHKFHFLTKIEIKMTYLVFLSCFHCLFAPRAIWKPFHRRLRFWVVLTIGRKIGLFDFLSEFLSDVLSKCYQISFPISCLISCQFHVRFLSDSSFVLLSVFVGCLENDDLENEVKLKSKLIIV